MTDLFLSQIFIRCSKLENIGVAYEEVYIGPTNGNVPVDMDKYSALWLGLLYANSKIIMSGTIPTRYFKTRPLETQYTSMWVSITYVSDVSISVVASQEGILAAVFGIK